MRMLHPAGHASQRPVDVPVLIAALGPKGHAVARELGDGLFATSQVPAYAREFSRVGYLFWGTVLNKDEDPRSERVRAAAGPGLALAFHAAYEVNIPLSDLAGGEQWQTVVNRTPPRERHLAVHEQHCVGLNEADRAAWDAGAHALLEHLTVSGSADQVRQRLADLSAQGVTELVYQPCGPDIRRELEAFMQAAKTAVPG